MLLACHTLLRPLGLPLLLICVLMHGQQRGYRLLLRGGYTGCIHIIFRSLFCPLRGFVRPIETSVPAGRVGSVRIEICDKPFAAVLE